MKKVYMTIRQVQNTRYTCVDSVERIFEDKEVAEQYKNTHNEQYPYDKLIVKEQEIVQSTNEVVFESFDYLVATCAFTDGELTETKFETKKGNTLDVPQNALDKVLFERKTKRALATISLNEQQKVRFQSVLEPQSKTVRTFTLCKRMDNKVLIENQKQSLIDRAIALHEKACSLEHVHLFPSSDNDIENWLNDATFDAEQEQMDWVERLQTQLLNAK